MSDTFISLAVAIPVTVGISYFELSTRLDYRPRRMGWQWWALRGALEVVVAIVAVALIQSLIAGIAIDGLLNTPVGIGFAAALAGPTIVRSRLFTLGKGPDARDIGVSLAYEPARDYLERHLDEIGSMEQTDWMKTHVLPKLEGRDPSDLVGWVTDWLNGVHFMPSDEKDSHLDYFASVIEDSASNAKKMEAILNRAVSIGGRRVVNLYLKRKVPARPVPNPD